MRGLESAPGFLTCKPRRKIWLKGLGFQDLARFCFRNRWGPTPPSLVPSPGPCYLCRVLYKCAGTRNGYKCAAEFKPCPLVTVNAEISKTCLGTYPHAGELVNAFHLSAKEAAKRSGMSLPKFRKLCRKRGIKIWSFKWFRDPILTATRPVDNLVDSVMDDLAKCLADPPCSPEDDLRARPEVKS